MSAGVAVVRGIGAGEESPKVADRSARGTVRHHRRRISQTEYIDIVVGMSPPPAPVASAPSSVESTMRSVATVLRDYRVMGHDDQEGMPWRYLSTYGGIVCKML